MTPAAEILLRIEKTRRQHSASVAREHRSGIGQFLTPTAISVYMASLFGNPTKNVRILDAGAGTGSLFVALVYELVSRTERPVSIHVSAIENDEVALSHLEKSMDICREVCRDAGVPFEGHIYGEDFIFYALNNRQSLFSEAATAGYTHAILNPPYKKISSASQIRKRLNASGFETSNLYSAFVWLSIQSLAPGGEIVAITPRSFCNGPYFKRFRKALLQLLNLDRIHIFESRTHAFSDDAVLQENIIFHGIRGVRQQKSITISNSRGADFSGAVQSQIPFNRVVLPGDKDAFIHIVESDEGHDVLDWMSGLRTSLVELGLEVSTGRVVDFRLREHLRQMPERDSVPLIYPAHFNDGAISWPSDGGKKPNAILMNEQTSNALVPNDYYVLTKRFSSKEEKRRVVAVLYDPQLLNAEYVGFENHLNFYHARTGSMEPDLARGIACYLNSTVFDKYFRLFSGHTQVNATDLRKAKYPTKEQLVTMGKRMSGEKTEQEERDNVLYEVCKTHE